MSSMSKTELEQTAAKMDEQQLVIRDLVLIAKSYLDSIDFEIHIATDRGETETIEELTESRQLIQETIERAESAPKQQEVTMADGGLSWTEKMATVEHGREMSEILKECKS